MRVTRIYLACCQDLSKPCIFAMPPHELARVDLGKPECGLKSSAAAPVGAVTSIGVLAVLEMSIKWSSFSLNSDHYHQHLHHLLHHHPNTFNSYISIHISFFTFPSSQPFGHRSTVRFLFCFSTSISFTFHFSTIINMLSSTLFTPVFATIALLTTANAAALQIREDCPAGLTYLSYDACSSGFLGCGVASQCTGSSRFITTSGECPSGWQTHQCTDPLSKDNTVIWRGCTKSEDNGVCDSILGALSAARATPETPSPVPSSTPEDTTTSSPEVTQTPATGSEPVPDPNQKCTAKDTWYSREGDCTSGFIGCMGKDDFCTGEKRFWGSCPPMLGSYFVCSNGFKGCTTDVNICSRPPFPSV